MTDDLPPQILQSQTILSAASRHCKIMSQTTEASLKPDLKTQGKSKSSDLPKPVLVLPTVTKGQIGPAVLVLLPERLRSLRPT